jgi:hypothetical protein
VPILLLPAVLGRRDDPALRVATYVGAASVVLSLIGFLRWVFVVPPLARYRLVGHTLRDHRAHPGPAPGSPSARSTCSTRATSWPPPSPASRSGTGRADRQHRPGPLGGRPRRHRPPAARSRSPAGHGRAQELSTASPRDLHPPLHAVSIRTGYRSHQPAFD